MIKNPEPGLEICDQILGFASHAASAFLSKVIFIIWEYLLQVNISSNILKWKAPF